MDDIFRQLTGLLLSSVPTVILFILICLAYRALVHNPLQSVLQERRSRTVGAIEKARTDVAAAQQKTLEDEQRLRDARTEIFQAQERRIAGFHQARETAIAETRIAAEAKIQAAKKEIENSAAAAKRSIQESAEALASEIIYAVAKGAPEAANMRG